MIAYLLSNLYFQNSCLIFTISFKNIFKEQLDDEDFFRWIAASKLCVRQSRLDQSVKCWRARDFKEVRGLTGIPNETQQENMWIENSIKKLNNVDVIIEEKKISEEKFMFQEKG